MQAFLAIVAALCCLLLVLALGIHIHGMKLRATDNYDELAAVMCGGAAFVCMIAALDWFNLIPEM